MIIRSMQATFGKLNGETLTLHEGLNILELPNEQGKSTWSEFLLAMLYGVDTRDRSKAGYLPVKEKYRPWSGAAMQGSLTVEQDGRLLTLERTGSDRMPMSRLNVYETESGLPVMLPDAGSWGEALIRAPRSVYERSGFLRQQQHEVTQDNALSLRLSALVTTGDETYAYPALEKKLRDLRNRCRANRSNGLIPETELALDQVIRQRTQAEALQPALNAAEAELQAVKAERATWEEQEKLCAALEAERQYRRVTAAEKELHEEQTLLETQKAQCAHLPKPEALKALAVELEQAASKLSAAQARLDAVPQPSPAPTVPEAMQGLCSSEAEAQLAEDRKQLAGLRVQQSAPGKLPMALAVLLAALGCAALAAGLLLPQLALVICGGVLLLGGALFALRQARIVRDLRAAQKNAEAQALALARRYGADSPDDLERCAQEAVLTLRQAEQREEERNAALDAARAELEECEHMRDALLDRVDAFGARTGELSEARSAVSEALESWQALAIQQEQVRRAVNHLDTLREIAGTQPAAAVKLLPGQSAPDPDTVHRGLASCDTRQRELQSKIDRLNGQRSASPDPLALVSQQELLESRLADLQRKYRGLEAAMEELDAANRTLQSRFSPMVCQLAGSLFSRLTDGRYTRVMLDPELHVTVLERDSAVSRPLACLSAGTADQLYLALRLAISELLLPQAPLVLDDALVAFDDARAAAALRVLREESQKRQILLFTCQSRERRLAEQQ